ncbi:hypothetical protein ACN23B_20315 [Anabaena sp. FACHB-709]|uniref:Uncharacterized protein n=2 Tax=Nostocaceae TaxID=1162 RepID=A0A1Z4KLA8_ANAVA|nr:MULTISPECIES: hypothetical protein [Nostocaceae]BAY69673.1 hypothetical protein NIES23_24680 [Trichormus variabilis NIES-23]HBW32407.1 hypothetical protein [Nostoc sp. UBA8866]MBD2173675.1 hypothetical protein [Anabaena cylindrica FACHB-318]MBD2265447.1 hypothetical protein [Anabaena sp. FACHB-709]MBD2274629.1 hypothetical protein [Nostoc sp. PCC 7120 = FACHB-418]
MNQEPRKLINLSVHESSDPSIISGNQNEGDLGNNDDLNDSANRYENIDVPTPQPTDPFTESTVVDRQITTANLSAG